MLAGCHPRNLGYVLQQLLSASSNFRIFAHRMRVDVVLPAFPEL